MGWSVLLSAVATAIAVAAFVRDLLTRRWVMRTVLASSLRPLLEQAREELGTLIAPGCDSQEWIRKFGPLQRRIEELRPGILDQELRDALALITSLQEGFRHAPPPGSSDPIVQQLMEDRDHQIERRGRVGEAARRGEAAALQALQRLSELEGRSGR
jgi:hypothetical protein